MTLENTRLIVKEVRVNDLLKEKKDLIEVVDEFKKINNKMISEMEELKHKLEVTEKLHISLKERYAKVVEG